MARAFTTTERDTAKAGHVWHLSRCEVLDVDDTWQDLSDLGPDGVDTLLGGTISRHLDGNVWQASIRVVLGYGDESLSPLMFASVFNRDVADVYAPLLNCGRRIRFWAQTALPTDDLGEIEEKLIFDGRIDVPNFTTDPMTLTCRDLGGKLIDTIIRRRVTYGDKDDPVPAADVIQQILTDAADLLGESITLVVPEEPEFVITERVIENISVMDAIQGVATLFGWVVTYRFQADGTFQLTLYDPLRDKDTPDYTLEPDEYIAIENAALDFTGGRNFIDVWYVDAVTGESLKVTAYDAGSIVAFGEKYLALGGEALAGITNGNDAADLAAYALADLSTPLFDHTAKNTFTWFAEIGDYVGFVGDNVRYDDDQALGLVSIVHEFPDGGSGAATTQFQCRGKPAGAYERWLRLQGGPVVPQTPPAPELMFALGEATQFGGTVDTVDGGIWLGYRMPAGVDEIRVHVLLGLTQDIGVPNIDNTTLALTIRRPEGDLGTPAIGVENMFPNRPGEYASLALLSTRPGLYKRILFYGVRDNLTSVPVITPARPAIDPSPTRIDGTIADMEIVRDGSTNTITVTPGTLEDTDDTRNGNWLCLMRNEHVLPPVYIKTDTTPVVFVDSGLPEDASYEAVYDAFIWNGGQSGPTFSGVAEAPTIEPPEWANGTPLPAMEGGAPKIQLSWTCATPGATGVRVEASLDGVSKRTVGTGGLTGTVYDADTSAKLYRLVAVNILGVSLAVTSWRWSTALPPTISNPSAVPQIVSGYPRVVIRPGSNIFSPTFVLAIAQRTATPGATWVRIQESDDNGVGDPWALVTNGESTSVAEWTWYSPTSDAIGEDKWYRVQAIAADGSTVLATSTAVHYVPAT